MTWMNYVEAWTLGHPCPVDYLGRAQLEWQANPTFTLLTVSIQVEVTSLSAGWRARALSVTREDHWGLLIFSNPFILRFPDDSSFDVGISRPEPDGHFDVWDWSTHEQHRPTCPACGAAVIRTTILDGSGPDFTGPVTVTDHCGDCAQQHHTTHYLHGIRD